MKKSFIVCFVLIALFIQNISGQELGDLYTTRFFSISVPRGWQSIDIGMDFLQINGPSGGAFPPNMNFYNVDYSGSVSDYVNVIMDSAPKNFSNFRILNRSAFSTTAGVTGEKVTYQGTMGTRSIRQIMYVFPNRRGTGIIEITGAVPISEGERLDATFDASVRTFILR